MATRGAAPKDLTSAPTDHRKPPLTAKELLASEIVGIWAGRAEVGDSPAFARRLREESQDRQSA